MSVLSLRRRGVGGKQPDIYEGCITIEFTETVDNNVRALTKNNNNVINSIEKLIVDGVEQPIQKNYQYTFTAGLHKVGWQIKDGNVLQNSIGTVSPNTSYIDDNALVTIPTNIVSIGVYGMREAPAYFPRRGVICYAVTPPDAADNSAVGSWFFPSDRDKFLYVPAESVEAYKEATGWSQYADKIVAIP